MEVGIFSERTKSNNRVCCGVRDCNSRANKNLNLIFHKFPKPGDRTVLLKDVSGNLEKIDKFEAWKKLLKINEVTPQMKICSLHFKRTDYLLPDFNVRKFLKRTAVPSCNLPTSFEANNQRKSRFKKRLDPEISKATGDKKVKRYTEEKKTEALKAISDGKMGVNEASKTFGIPRSSLASMSLKFESPNVPASTLIESQMVNWILESSRKGFQPRKECIQASAQQMLDKLPHRIDFINVSSNRWYNDFIKRYPILEVDSSKPSTTSTLADQSRVRKWFGKIESYLKDEGFYDILKDPSRIYYCDENDFLVCTQYMNILAFKSSTERRTSKLKTNLTILFTSSATGSMSPPLIVYPDVTTDKLIPDSVPPGWYTEKTFDGYMTPELMIVYLKKILYPHLQKNGVIFPVIVFVNERASHITMEVTEVCRDLQIILICLYQNPSMILHHEAIEALQLMRKLWPNAVRQWRTENSSIIIGLEHTIAILKIVYDQMLLEKEAFARGFREFGLFPWDVNGVKYIKCSSTKSEQVPTEQQSTSHDNITMKFIDFVDIVGNNMISDFEQNADKMVSPRTAEELHGKLYQLYKTFMSYRGNESEVMEWNPAQVQIKYEDDLSD